MTILCTYVPWSSLAGNHDNIIWFITKVVSINDIDSQYHVNTEAKKWLQGRQACQVMRVNT